VLAFVEPHLISSDVISVPGFSCFHRSDCHNTRNSEGALVFIKDSRLDDLYNNQTVVYKEASRTGHCIMVVFYVDKLKLIMLYKSPKFSRRSFLAFLESNLENNQSEPVVVFGDININMMSEEGKQVQLLFNKFNLETRFNYNLPTTDGGTHIDVCFSNCHYLNAWHYESYWSYHKAICFSWPRSNSF